MTQCPNCLSEVDESYLFCPNCGMQLISPASSAGPPLPGGTPVPAERPRRSGLRLAAVLLVVVLIVLASLFFVLPSTPFAHTTTTAPPVGCPPTPSTSTTVSAPTPNYDAQQVMLFSQSYSQLAVNVTAIAQCDTNGYGPSYLLNGLTNAGYWYQVGVDWNWPLQSAGYAPGFGFVSEAWAPGGFTGASPFVAFSGPVNSGDIVELSLNFTGGQVIASAVDLNTSATGSMSYPARSASEFVGTQAQSSQPRFSFATQGYFTGLMTEWYHVDPNYGGSQSDVTYSTDTPIVSATFGVSEWNFTSSPPSTVLATVANDGAPVTLTSQLRQFALSGYSLAASSDEFVTGA